MNIDLEEKVIPFLKLIGEDSRLKIIYFLKNFGHNAKEIEDHIKKSQSRVSTHLKKLIDMDLVEVRYNNNLKYYYIKNNELFTVLDAIIDYIHPSTSSQIKKLQKENFKQILQ